MTNEYIKQWALAHPLDPIHVDCATAVMLKILDGKCKMFPEEKIVMSQLYDQVKSLPGALLDNAIHELIACARRETDDEDDEMQWFIYEKRLLAESMISRPVMKDFKTMIRIKGLFNEKGQEMEVLA